MRPGRGATLMLAAVLAGLSRPALAADSGSTTQSVNVSIGPLAKLNVVQSTLNLGHVGTVFANFTGNISIQYKVRTRISTGTASLTARATEFSPTTGPSIANADLKYTCSGASQGAGCSGTQTMTTSSQTNVVTVGSGACTGTGCPGSDPNTVTVSLDLANSPTFKSGTYSTTVTFTISAP